MGGNDNAAKLFSSHKIERFDSLQKIYFSFVNKLLS